MGKGPEHFTPKKTQNGQQAHEKIFNFITYQGNGKQKSL